MHNSLPRTVFTCLLAGLAAGCANQEKVSKQPGVKAEAGRASAPDGGQREIGGVFVYWFVADGEVTADHGRRMWTMAKELLTTGVLQRWAYVICYAPCALGQEDATFEQMKEFIAASVPEFQLTHGPPVARVSRR